MKEKETLQLIGQNIKRFRVQNELSQAELAGRCKIQKSSISRMEAGKTNMTIRTLITICNTLQLEVSQLIAK